MNIVVFFSFIELFLRNHGMLFVSADFTCSYMCMKTIEILVELTGCVIVC